MVQDPSISVRSQIALTLQGVLRHDRDLAVKLFIALCETNDILLSTRYAEEFFKYAVPTHFDELSSILVRMIDSEIPEVRKSGARQVCLASLAMEQVLPLARRCIPGTQESRMGCAEIYAVNLGNSTYRSACEGMLISMFNDQDAAIRSEAAICFNRIDGNELVQIGVNNPTDYATSTFPW